ncbi:hypothetical protein BH09BAC3_BH09BAC3_19170 [soil metagenome]
MNRIQTYDDLLAEKAELEKLLIQQKAIIRQDIAALKEELRPAAAVVKFIGKITAKDRSNSLLNVGMSLATDLVLRNLVLAKSGWITKLIIPFAAKTLGSSAFVHSKAGGMLNNLISRLTTKRAA